MPLALTGVRLDAAVLSSPELAELLAQYVVGSNPLLGDVRPLSRLSAVNRALRAVAWWPLLRCRGEFTLATRLQRTRPLADEPAERLEQWCEQWQARVDGLRSSLQAWLAETPAHAVAEHAPCANVVLRPDATNNSEDAAEFLDLADGALARRLAKTCDALDTVIKRAGPELRAVATLTLSALYTFFLHVGNAKTFNLALGGLTRSLESKSCWQELGDVRGTTLLAAVRLAAVVRGARHSNESGWQLDEEGLHGIEEMRRAVDVATAADSTPVERARVCIALTTLLDEFTHVLVGPSLYEESCVTSLNEVSRVRTACNAGSRSQELAKWCKHPIAVAVHFTRTVLAMRIALSVNMRVLRAKLGARTVAAQAAQAAAEALAVEAEAFVQAAEAELAQAVAAVEAAQAAAEEAENEFEADEDEEEDTQEEEEVEETGEDEEAEAEAQAAQALAQAMVLQAAAVAQAATAAQAAAEMQAAHAAALQTAATAQAAAAAQAAVAAQAAIVEALTQAAEAVAVQVAVVLQAATATQAAAAAHAAQVAAAQAAAVAQAAAEAQTAAAQAVVAA